MAQRVRLCAMNLIRRACAMSFMARNRSGVVARMSTAKNRQRRACCFVKLGSKV